jgi:hypothetical protein
MVARPTVERRSSADNGVSLERAESSRDKWLDLLVLDSAVKARAGRLGSVKLTSSLWYQVDACLQ